MAHSSLLTIAHFQKVFLADPQFSELNSIWRPTDSKCKFEELSPRLIVRGIRFKQPFKPIEISMFRICLNSAMLACYDSVGAGISASFYR
jgi:hypothetical protein